jgi:hypothetical protein
MMRSDVPASAVPKQTAAQRAANRVKRALSLGTYEVHFVYLAPADKPLDQKVGTVNTIHRAAKELQRWYRWRMGGGLTFGLADPVVAAYQTLHASAWYSTHDAGGDRSGWYWANALQELRDQAGGGFYQEFDDWVVYLDAEPGQGQYSGGTSGGFHSGVCVLGERDCNALMGLDHEWTPCREIGGLGHEAGHSLGLPHPPAGPDWATAIMGIGYMIYPQCVLTAADKTWLSANPHFRTVPKITGPMDICPFPDDRPPPAPRGRPIPTPRPR